MEECIRIVILTASLLLIPAASAMAEPWAAKTETSEAASPLSAQKLNPTGRTLETEVPLKVGGTRLGDIAIKITADDKVFVDAKLLRTYTSKIILPKVLDAALSQANETSEAPTGGITMVGKKSLGGSDSSLVQIAAKADKDEDASHLGQEPPSYVPLEAIKQRGLDLAYDPQALEVQVRPTIDQRPTVDLTMQTATGTANATLEQPAHVSFYLNMRMAESYVEQSAARATGFAAPYFDFDGALRIGSVVIEGEGSFHSGNSEWFAPSYFQDYVFYRKGTRIVYDLPEEAIRVRIGDVTPELTSLQTSPDLLGLSVATAHQELQPMKSIRPTGAHSFRIEHPSSVEIVVDGVLLRRIRLAPGNYNLSDLPLKPGANKVDLIIEDESGQRQTLTFTDFSGDKLIAPGISEWSFSAGVKSFDSGAPISDNATSTTIVGKSSPDLLYGQRQYYFGQPAATAFYRTGLTSALTASGNVQVDTNVAMGGTGFVTETTAGLITGEFEGSAVRGKGPGYGVQLGYAYDKFDWFGPYKSTFRILGEYRSQNFGTVATFEAPQNYYASLAATYSQQLPFDISAGLSLSYYLAEPNRWQADFTLSTQIWDTLSGSLSLGYTEDQSLSNASSKLSNQNGLQAFVRLSWSSDSHASALASFDSRSDSTQATYSQTSETSGVGSWSATATVSTSPDGTSAVNASGLYAANRADITVTHASNLDGLGFAAPFRPSSGEETSSIAVATSFVYADGAWGIGRPVSNGFALITPHKSLEGSPVVIGSPESVIAESDWLGPAVISSGTPYRESHITYDAPGAPSGYDLGSATFDMKAPYKSGYNLKAGSAYAITAVGTLLDSDGQPVSLLAGEAKEAGKESGRKVELFTNRAGRFGAQGLAPGKWLIEMPTEPEPSHYEIEIPEGATGLYDAGALKPSGGGHTKPPVIEAETDHDTN